MSLKVHEAFDAGSFGYAQVSFGKHQKGPKPIWIFILAMALGIVLGACVV